MLTIIDTHHEEETDDFFEAHARLFWLLGEKTRLHILYLLAEQPGQVCVEELTEKIGYLGQSAISYHLHLLYQEGLISREDNGLYKYYRIRACALDDLRHILIDLSR